MSTRAAIMTDFLQPLTLGEIELAEPGPDEVLVKVAASGVCHTDLSVIEAKLPYPPPVILGHEGAGVVEAVGSQIRHVKPGDHVVMAGVSVCGSCHYCDTQKPHLCASGTEAALAGEDYRFTFDGMPVARFIGVASFAERTVARGSSVVKIPNDIPLTRACLLGCAVVTGIGAVLNSAQVRPGQTVAVLGCGGVGLNIIQGAVIAGATQIIAVDLSAEKLENARQFGATHVVQAGNEPSDDVIGLTQGLGVDFAFDAVGTPDVVRQAFVSVKRGGSAVVVGVPGFGIDYSIPGSLVAIEERRLIGSLLGSAYLPRDMPRLVGLYQSGHLELDALVTREIGLDDINHALDLLRAGDGIRSVIVYD